MLVNKLNSTEKYKLRDEGFSPAQSDNYNLAVEIGDKHLSLAIYDTKKNKFLVLEYYTLNSLYTANTLAQNLVTFFSEHDFNSLRFKKVVVSYVSTKFTLVPSNLFDINKKEQLFEFNNKKDVSLEIKHTVIKALDAVVVFGIPLQLYAALTKIFKSFELKNSITTFIETSLKNKNNSFHSEVFICFYDTIMHTVVIKNNKLILANSYTYVTANDALYYITMLVKQFDLNGNEIRINVSGVIDTNNDIFIGMQKFGLNFNLKKQDPAVDSSFKLQSIPQHYFLNLYNVALCE